MTVNELNILEKKKQNGYMLSLIFLIFCILLSGGIYIYSHRITTHVQQLDASLAEIQASIVQRELDPLVQSYMMYERNKVIFSRLEYISQIPDHVSHLKLTMLRYGLTILGFSYNDGTIQTRVSSDNDARGFGYEKITNFVRGYRGESESLFTLNFIQSFTGHDRVQHELTLDLKELSDMHTKEIQGDIESPVVTAEEIGSQGDTQTTLQDITQVETQNNISSEDISPVSQ